MTAFGPIRLTLDYGVQAWPVQKLAFDGAAPATPISDQQIIVEMKYRVDLPTFFKELVERFTLNPTRVSKYRLAVVALGFVNEAAPGAAQEEPPSSSVCLTS